MAAMEDTKRKVVTDTELEVVAHTELEILAELVVVDVGYMEAVTLLTSDICW